jgi:Protein of unknown function (DUF2851).
MNEMERLLHYVWKYKLYGVAPLKTTKGKALQIIDPGIANNDAGPDFFNAKIRIDHTLWAGSVEIHEKASDWLLHHHDRDKAYESIILHVTGCNDLELERPSGEHVPQLVLTIPESVKRNIEWLLYRDTALPCQAHIYTLDSLHIRSWLDALLSERLERKTKDILSLLEHYKNDWNEVFYIILTRSFGFGINSDAMERLARSLPLHCIQKQRGSCSQVEAMLFGQAGMLTEKKGDAYYRFLQQEYNFLSHKYGLTSIDHSVFRNLRLRPYNFPYLKIAQLAAIWIQHDTLFSIMLNANNMGEIKKHLRLSPSEYWTTHYHFNIESAKKEKLLGENAMNTLIINAVVPIFFAYGLHNKLPEYCEKATHILQYLPPEKNTIASAFNMAGITCNNAGDTQALIQLKREYCEKKKCLFCRIGFRLLKEEMQL